MSKLKIEHGISRIKRAKLQTYIDQSISDDIQMMAEWSNNEFHYIVNELLRFALTQNEEFQKFKTERNPGDAKISGVLRTAASPATTSALSTTRQQ